MRRRSVAGSPERSRGLPNQTGLINQTDLLAAFARASDALFDAGVTRSDSFTGEIGEFVASRTLGLTLVGRNVALIDATKGGRGYQIKSVASANRRAAIPLPSLVPGFDVVVGVRLSLLYEPIEVIEIDRADIPLRSRVVTESLLAVVPCRRHTSFPDAVTTVSPLLTAFGRAYQALLDTGIIRTRRIVGDVGERYAAAELDLQLVDDPTTAGYDAVDGRGKTYEIKTRRVYASGRRTSESRRINNLVGKSADILVVVRLDHAFRCTGLWTMPLRNVINPKSASMANILRTRGIVRVK